MSEENQEKFLQKLKNDKKFRFEFIIGIWSGIISLMLVVALVFVTKYFILNDNSIESDDVVEETPVTTTAQAVTVRETDPPYDNAIINGNEEDFDDGEDDGDELKSAEKAYATTVVNVRSEPSLTASVIGKLQKGQEVKIVEFDKEWTKISYNTTEGYVSTICFRHNALAPIFFRNVIPQLCRQPMYISLSKNADAADHFIIYCNSKGKGPVFICRKHSRNKICPVLLRVWIRQSVSEIILYIFIRYSRR